MSKIDQSLKDLYGIDTLANKDQWVNRIHPLVKFILTIVYIFIVVSFQQYDLMGLLGMGVYLLVVFQLADLSFYDCLRRLKVVLPLICLLGIANLWMDQTVIQIGKLQITTGMVSMLTLMIKGIFSVLASYVLVTTTTMDGICHAMRMIHIPSILVTQFMLTYRYIAVLMTEVNRMVQAYSLRAPGQNGIQFKVWGSLTGQLLLRSIQRANDVYESMILRGFDGSFRHIGKGRKLNGQDVLYLTVWLAFFIFARKVPFIILIGNQF